MSTRARALFVLSAALPLLSGACADVPLVEVRGPDGTLRLRVEADFARTADARREGLAGRDGLDEGRGLLLVFPTEGEVCIENTPVGFAIDAIFANAAGRVIAIERDIPAGDATSRCHQPVAQVLELAGGVALSVQVGDVLEQAP
ncbi:MAG: DUF192 domain-containing protein [Sandaracinaceae bacterium]|nr:DUF192 domain-containing protein [Sandaracinaceae bacterium]